MHPGRLELDGYYPLPVEVEIQMLIKIQKYGMEIRKTSLNEWEKPFMTKYIQELHSGFVTTSETENYYYINGMPGQLYNILVTLSRDFDLELI